MEWSIHNTFAGWLEFDESISHLFSTEKIKYKMVSRNILLDYV